MHQFRRNVPVDCSLRLLLLLVLRPVHALPCPVRFVAVAEPQVRCSAEHQAQQHQQHSSLAGPQPDRCDRNAFSDIASRQSRAR
uniref:Putative secreted protein n=1 Tax=Anopheles triannulatus TaxID=58253 RepID=A0A2M4B7G6_9DIPT